MLGLERLVRRLCGAAVMVLLIGGHVAAVASGFESERDLRSQDANVFFGYRRRTC